MMCRSSAEWPRCAAPRGRRFMDAAVVGGASNAPTCRLFVPQTTGCRLISHPQCTILRERVGSVRVSSGLSENLKRNTQ